MYSNHLKSVGSSLSHAHMSKGLPCKIVEQQRSSMSFRTLSPSLSVSPSRPPHFARPTRGSSVCQRKDQLWPEHNPPQPLWGYELPSAKCQHLSDWETGPCVAHTHKFLLLMLLLQIRSLQQTMAIVGFWNQEVKADSDTAVRIDTVTTTIWSYRAYASHGLITGHEDSFQLVSLSGEAKPVPLRLTAATKINLSYYKRKR